MINYRHIILLWVIIAILISSQIAIGITNNPPLYTQNHCPDSNEYVCPSTGINPYSLSIHLSITLGLVLPLLFYAGVKYE